MIASFAGRRAVFWWILALCLAVRAAACLQTRLVSTDGVTFFYMAQEIARGDWGSALAQDQHPLYPAWLAIFYGATGDPQAAFTGSMLAVSALLFLLLWRVAERVSGARAAAWTGFLFSVHPLFVRNAADFLSETPVLVFAALGILALVRWIEMPSVRNDAVLGVVAGLGYLVRQEAVEVLLGAGLVFGILWARGRISAGRSCRAILVSAAVFLLIVGPYFLYLRADEGRWMISRKKGFFALFPWLDPAYEVHPEVPAPGGAGLILAVRVWIHRWDFWYEFQKSVVGAFHPLFLVLAAFGGWLAWRGTDRAPRRAPAGIIFGSFLALHVAVLLALYNGAGYLEKRHSLFAVLMVLPWAGLGLARLAAGWAPGKGGAILLVAVLGTVFLYPVLKPRRTGFASRGVYAAIGESVAANPAARGVLAAPRGRAGQWIAWSAVTSSRRGGGGRAERPLGMALFEPGGGRLPLTGKLLARCGAVVCDEMTRRQNAEVLSGWPEIDRWTVDPGGGQEGQGGQEEVWTLHVPAGSAR